MANCCTNTVKSSQKNHSMLKCSTEMFSFISVIVFHATFSCIVEKMRLLGPARFDLINFKVIAGNFRNIIAPHRQYPMPYNKNSADSPFF